MSTIKHKDLFSIIDVSKRNFANQTLPIFVSGKKAEYVDLVHLSMLESLLMYLNGKGLLTEQVEIDYTDDSNSLESLD